VNYHHTPIRLNSSVLGWQKQDDDDDDDDDDDKSRTAAGRVRSCRTTVQTAKLHDP